MEGAFVMIQPRYTWRYTLTLYRSIRDPEETMSLILVTLVNLAPLSPLSGAIDLRAHHRSVMCSSGTPIN